MIAVGVPLIVPFAVFRDKPAGSDGDTEYEVTVPPVDVGEMVVMAVPFSKVRVFELYVINGATSLTTMVKLV